ncbi:Kelch repeat-containing F-box family protein [Prunus dulcis]|uniref:Kelch repeat-containing F-box family protein n=1 Tax=Prunus dulcis TaxID=3755 RepID=A0A5H2Y991_PRUDU|nr:Kelch repeat-containing F-box family protein [Prunus dulcis]
MAEFQTQTTKSKVEEDQQEAPLYGDILESILSHVPLLHLVPPATCPSPGDTPSLPPSATSTENIKPWLIVLTQTTRYPYVTSALAYDPASQVWIDIHPQPSNIPSIPILRSSHSTLLYMLSPSKFAFSTDPLHHTWHHAAAPLVWRTDPIVALVGHRIIVAGGTCDYEDDPLAVEMYDVTTRTWDTCDSMPAILKDSAASTWLSVAVDDSKMYVTEKISGVTYSFDPNSKAWFGPYDLRPDGSVFISVIGFANGRLILVGAVGNAENLKGVKVWEVKGALLERKEMIGEMPAEMVEMVKGRAVA